MALDTRLGVLFQHGALFSALTVKENIQLPMREYLDLPQSLMDELAYLKIEMVGLPPDGRRQISIRTVGRHDQARCTCPCPGARSGPRFPR
jgi:ABC-type transporter Mla maintaining outer membrane lipid asymmetry ATPase subunit MlaF